MKQVQVEMGISTEGKGFTDITKDVSVWVASQKTMTGLLTLFIRHTSASLTIQENADPDVLTDLEKHFTRLVPEKAGYYRHTTEGPDDMPAHIKCSLTETSIVIPVTGGRLALGKWQGIYLFEHRTEPQHRGIFLHLIGE